MFKFLKSFLFKSEPKNFIEVFLSNKEPLSPKEIKIVCEEASSIMNTWSDEDLKNFAFDRLVDELLEIRKRGSL